MPDLRRGVLLAASLAMVGCSTTPGGENGPAGSTGSGIIIAPDSGFHLPNFSCDAGELDRDVPASDAAVDAGACAVTNPTVRFQIDVLPVLSGCTGELCHAPWTYGTTVNVVSSECCDHRKIIDPGKPAASYLLQKVRGVELCGNSSKMGDVSPAVAQSIQDWICLGALDN